MRIFGVYIGDTQSRVYFYPLRSFLANGKASESTSECKAGAPSWLQTLPVGPSQLGFDKVTRVGIGCGLSSFVVTGRLHKELL